MDLKRHLLLMLCMLLGAKMLLENQVNFLITNNLNDWSNLETIIVPGECEFTRSDQEKFDGFLSEGGKLILMGKAGLDPDKDEFIFDIGADYTGEATADIDYTIAGEKLLKDLPTAPFLNYFPALRVRPHPGTEILATIREPYFNRTLSHYSSHRNTPFKLTDADHPAVINKGNITYIASDLAGMYHTSGAKVHRDLFNNVLDLVFTSRMLEVDLPSQGRANLLHQPEHRRYVAHLLYASPITRGDTELIEDLVPIYGTRVKLNVPETVRSVRLIPHNEDLEIITADTGIFVIVPEFRCHTAVVFEY